MRISNDVMMSRKTTWGTGGTARRVIEPEDTEETADAVRMLKGERYAVIGGGSNMLVSDGVLGIPFIDTGRLDKVLSVRRVGDQYKAVFGAGVLLSAIVFWASGKGSMADRGGAEALSGVEQTAGIPGTIGGAVIGNAGTSRGSIGSAVSAVTAVDADGTIKRITKDSLDFQYRRSSLIGTGTVVTEVELELHVDSVLAVRDRMSETLIERSGQPTGARTAGCVFKNPVGMSAGYLLDQAGCKGMSCGGAYVSEVHANFIVNGGSAASSDISRLIEMCRERVREVHGVDLELEIKIIG